MTRPKTDDRVQAQVVIVHFGDVEPTVACLKAVAADPSPIERTVVVVDNSANFPEERLTPGTHLLRCPDNPGFGEGVNRGVAFLASRSPEPPDGRRLLVVLNHDVEILPGFLRAAARALSMTSREPPTSPVLGAAAGPIFLDGPSGPLWYAGGAIRFWSGTVSQSTSRQDAERRRLVGFIPGAALALRPEAFRDAGGFDPAIFLYNEDVDLCLRLRRRGWKLAFEPEMASVHHLGHATGSAMASPLYLEQLTASRLRPFRPFFYRLYLAVLHTGWVLLRAVLLLTRRGRAARPQVRALLKGHLRALRSLTG